MSDGLITVCIHNVSEVTAAMLPEYHIRAQTSLRDELLRSLQASQDVDAIIISLDEDSALMTIAAIQEVCPGVALVGVTGESDVDKLLAANRAGCAQILSRPVDSDDLSLAIRRAMGRQVSASTNHTYGVVGTRGGAGSTTIASHLAVEIAALTKASTAIFDLDLEFGGVARAFDLDPDFTLTDLASAGEIDVGVLTRAGVKLSEGLRLYARPNSIKEAHAITAEQISAIFDIAEQSYDRIVIDLPSHLTPETGVGLDRSDRLLIVVQLTVPSLLNAHRLMQALRDEGVGNERMLVVVNRFRRSVAPCTLELVAEKLGQEPFAVIPNDYMATRTALDAGKPLAARHPIRVAIREMAARLLGLGDARPAVGGWLQRIGLGR